MLGNSFITIPPSLADRHLLAFEVALTSAIVLLNEVEALRASNDFELHLLGFSV